MTDRLGFGSPKHRLLEKIVGSTVRLFDGAVVAPVWEAERTAVCELIEMGFLRTVPKGGSVWVEPTPAAGRELSRPDAKFERRILAGSFTSDGTFVLT